MNIFAAPKVAVCLAAYNGMNYLPIQLGSILMQEGVSLTLFVSVDQSVDGTEVWIDSKAKHDSRIVVLPHGEHLGSAAKNFFRLLQDVDFSEFDYVSFADQDDIWLHDKLVRHVKLMQASKVDAVSSNVMAFYPDGKIKLVDKSQPQREFDYLFESAGPGCTFLMTKLLVSDVKRLLSDSTSIANQVVLHDWLVYAVCRASGKNWLIDSKPSLQYRQHDKNVIGANAGLKSKLIRLQRVSCGWYRQEVLKVLTISYKLSNNPKLLAILRLLEKSDLLSRIKLLRFVPQARRKVTDRFILALMIILGLF